jgi:SWI/SNF-related matrix-associated actin-dependent regulator 1 of chromatin subfamily A
LGLQIFHLATLIRHRLFLSAQRNQGDDDERSRYEKDRIAHAKRIMKPFFLRRLKSEVLTDLPQKSEEVIRVPMNPQQQEQILRSSVSAESFFG